jgi:hypothetical protein
MVAPLNPFPERGEGPAAGGWREPFMRTAGLPAPSTMLRMVPLPVPRRIA